MITVCLPWGVTTDEAADGLVECSSSQQYPELEVTAAVTWGTGALCVDVRMFPARQRSSVEDAAVEVKVTGISAIISLTYTSS